MTQDSGADWPIVTGEKFRERREHLNLTQEQLAKEAGIKSYETIGAVEKGKGSVPSRRKIADALTRLEAEGGTRALAAEQPPQPQLIEFEVTGDFGVRVVVKGPVENAAELEASVARLIRDMKSDPSPRRGETA